MPMPVEVTKLTKIKALAELDRDCKFLEGDMENHFREAFDPAHVDELKKVLATLRRLIETITAEI